MTSSKTAVALAPSPDNREVAIDRTVTAPPVNLTGAIGELMQSLKGSLGNMNADDISVEVSAHSDASRSSASIKLRAYRRAERRDD
jgi:hypothetical protein